MGHVWLTCRLVPSERDPLHQGIIVERAQLKQRDFSLDLTSRLGKSQVITNTTPLNQQVGHNAMSARSTGLDSLPASLNKRASALWLKMCTAGFSPIFREVLVLCNRRQATTAVYVTVY